MRTIVEQDERHAHFPDYAVTMTEDMVCFTNRRVVVAKAKPHSGDLFDRHPNPVVSEKGFSSARQAAPRYDIHALYHEWVSWWRDSGCPELTSPDAAFSSFCRKRHERAPLN